MKYGIKESYSNIEPKFVASDKRPNLQIRRKNFPRLITPLQGRTQGLVVRGRGLNVGACEIPKYVECNPVRGHRK